MACSSELAPDCGNELWVELCAPVTAPEVEPVAAAEVPACEPACCWAAAASPCTVVELPEVALPVVLLAWGACGFAPLFSSACGRAVVF